MSRQTISLCMITKNEEAHIDTCLSSAKKFVDEIIVVDTGSTDKTKSIAKSHGAKVVDLTWENNFSTARNESLKHATKDWVLVLDADEVLDPSAGKEMQELLEEYRGNLLGFQLQQRNYCDDTSLAGWTAVAGKYARGKKGYFDVPLTRLFPRDTGLQFRYAIHEDITPSIIGAGGEIEVTSIPIHHYGYAQGNDVMEEKRERNKSILQESIRNDPNDAKAHFELGRMCREEGALEQAQRCFDLATELKPTFGRAHAALGEVYLQLESFDAAKEHLEEAQGCGYTAEQVSSNLGIVYAKMGQPKQAIEHFQQALELSPRNARVLHNLGTLLMKENRVHDAIKLFGYATKVTGLPKFKELVDDISEKLEQHVDELEDAYAKKFSLEVANRLGFLYTQLGLEEDATRILHDAVSRTDEKTPLVVNMYVNLAQMYAKTDKKKAKILLDEVIAWKPPGVEFLEEMRTKLK